MDLPTLQHPFIPNKVQAPEPGESKTAQSFKDKCDLKHIISQYDNIGHLLENRPQAESYIDIRHLQNKPVHQLIMEYRDKVALLSQKLEEERRQQIKERKDELEAKLKELQVLKDKQNKIGDPPPDPVV